MMPTIRPGEEVAVYQVFYPSHGPLHRGEIILYSRPGTRDRYLHRVIAVGGDTVQLIDGRLVVNGAMVPTKHLCSASKRLLDGTAQSGDVYEETIQPGVSYFIMHSRTAVEFDNTAPIKIQKGQLFVLGDYRSNAADSRDFGPISEKDAIAAVLYVSASSDPTRVNHYVGSPTDAERAQICRSD